MSLDKWLKPEKKKKPSTEEPKPKKEKIKEEKGSSKKIPEEKESEVPQITEAKLSGMKKYILTCPTKTCKFQKTKVVGANKELTEKDKVCPKCKGQLKIKEN